MKDKVAVITDSTSGIGLEIAKHFAKTVLQKKMK